ncbi:MAG: hypothetical protein DI577_06780 [Microbacterium sp.]|nr:MAG: hypothetical protein DI577_06780 [Microbacterium sp.]PZU35683.1 MAG: hypothetical protein DI575_06780 [Microbacterium sp.]
MEKMMPSLASVSGGIVRMAATSSRYAAVATSSSLAGEGYDTSTRVSTEKVSTPAIVAVAVTADLPGTP